MAFKNKNSQNISISWINLDQNRGLIWSNNTENGAKIDDLSAKKAKNTPQPQNGFKTQEKRQKTAFLYVFERFQVKIQPTPTRGYSKKFKINFLRFKKLTQKAPKSFSQIKFGTYFLFFLQNLDGPI